MKGIFGGYVAGLLQHVEGSMIFITSDGEAFNVPLVEVKDVKWPKLQMGFGFEANVLGQKYKLTFMKPNGAPELGDSGWSHAMRYTRVGIGIDSIRALSKAKESKRAAQEWRALIGG